MTPVPSRRLHSPQKYTNRSTWYIKKKKKALTYFRKKVFCFVFSFCFLINGITRKSSGIFQVAYLIWLVDVSTPSWPPWRTWCLRLLDTWLRLKRWTFEKPLITASTVSGFRAKCLERNLTTKCQLFPSLRTSSISSRYTVQHPPCPESFYLAPWREAHYPLWAAWASAGQV